jgi:NADPH2:quinone reductase
LLRSAPVTIMGTAGVPPWEILTDAFQQVMQHAASGQLRIDTEAVPLTDIEAAWARETPGRRLVVIP